MIFRENIHPWPKSKYSTWNKALERLMYWAKSGSVDIREVQKYLRT